MRYFLIRVICTCVILQFSNISLAQKNTTNVIRNKNQSNFSIAIELAKDGKYSQASIYLQKVIKNSEDKNYLLACFTLANYYFESRKGIAKNSQEAAKYYNWALNKSFPEAEAGNAEAQYIASICIRNAKYQRKAAFEWLEKAAKQNYAPAQAELAFCYMKGTGVKQDFKQAIEWARKAANQGNMLGKAIVGAYYLNVKKDFSKGIELIKESAESGNPGGQYNLFRCLYYGKGIKKDRKKAIELLQKAADQGLDDAITKLKIINLPKANEKNVKL